MPPVAPRLRVHVPDDLADLLHQPRRLVAEGAKAGMRASRQPVIRLFRQRYRAGGLGRLAMAWTARAYPERGRALGPSLYVTVRGGESTRQALVAHGLGATITAKRGRYLPVPTKLAGRYMSTGVSKWRITPRVFEIKTGIKLRFVPGRGSRPALLVADAARVSKRGVRAAKGGTRTKTGRLKSGLSTAIVFVLVRSVSLRRRADLGRLKNDAGKMVAHSVREGIYRHAQGS